MPPTLDSAGKVMEQVSIWEFFKRSGERAEKFRSQDSVLVVELNGQWASLVSLLSVIIYLWLSLLASVYYFCSGAPHQGLAMISSLGTFQQLL